MLFCKKLVEYINVIDTISRGASSEKVLVCIWVVVPHNIEYSAPLTDVHRFHEPVPSIITFNRRDLG